MIQQNKLQNYTYHDFKTLIDELKIRGYSRQTIDSYGYINTKFLGFARKSPKNVNKSDIENYLVMLYDKNIASATRHLVCSALKFYYEIVLKRRFNLIHPKKSNRLPIVLSKEEIIRMIESLLNPKHKLLLELIYGSELRVGEAIKIKIEDFDISNKILIIRKGKGDKDRIVNLSEKFIIDFINFVKETKSGYIFESEQRIGKHISYVQKLLGHSRLSTTQPYIRLSNSSIRNIKSPLD